jgi:hypothetical protein
MGHIKVAVLLTLGLAGGAFADNKSNTQKKVDAAKIEACENVKKTLSAEDAKGRCRDEHVAAKKLTCSASTFKEVNDLNARCLRAPRAKPEAKPQTKPAAPSRS